MKESFPVLFPIPVRDLLQFKLIQRTNEIVTYNPLIDFVSYLMFKKRNLTLCSYVEELCVGGERLHRKDASYLQSKGYDNHPNAARHRILAEGTYKKIFPLVLQELSRTKHH